VLQVQDVFLDVVNGKRAKRNEVLQAFDCTDLDSVSFYHPIFVLFVLLG
jgi:ribosome maturation protein Sdo1